MRRALNEIYSMCQKAAEGAGAPAGLDSDAAHGVVWLLGHGLTALGGLLDTLEQIPQQPHRCRFDTWLPASADTLDADGKAGALIAPGLIDLLVAASGRQAGRLTLLNLSMPLYLLPRAAHYARDGLSFHFAVLDPGGNRFVLEVLPEGEVTLWGSAGNRGERLLTADTRFAVAAVCAQSLAALPAAGTGGLDVMMDKTSLAAAYTTALADGIDIEPALWQRLQSLAARVLVPASAQSRLRGAGAQISDQD
jgi:hypothetical protein